MGLDYSYLLFFKRQDPWNLLDGVASFANRDLENHTAVYYPDRIMRLPFEAWAGTEDLLPIPYDDQSDEWNFMTALYFEPDEELLYFAERNAVGAADERERISVGYIYLTVRNDWSGYGEAYDPSLLLLEFTAATTGMSILFAQSSSMRAAFSRLLRDFQGVYGLIDREDDAVLFWLRNEEMEFEIPHAWMPLGEIEDYIYRGGAE